MGRNKRWLGMVIAFIMVVLLSGGALADGQMTLYGDFSFGNPGASEDEFVKTQTEDYVGDLGAFMLADALTQWTGLDFTIDAATEVERGILIDWSSESTLIKGLDDREQKEDFHFYDAEQLNYFMLDSMAQTVQQNLGYENVFYAASGESLGRDVLFVIDMLPTDLEYISSAFIYAHADVKGEGMDDEEFGELGYDDEEGYGDPYLAFVETVKLPGQQTHIVQITSDEQVIIEGFAKDYDVAIANRTIEPFFDLDNLETEAQTWASQITEGTLIGGELTYANPIHNFSIFPDEDFSAKTSYPSYLMYWQDGQNEDLRENMALVTFTDACKLIYSLSTTADHLQDNEDEMRQVLAGLTIEQVEPQ